MVVVVASHDWPNGYFASQSTGGLGKKKEVIRFIWPNKNIGSKELLEKIQTTLIVLYTGFEEPVKQQQR